MKYPGFIGPAYQLNSRNVDSQRCVNLFPEIVQSGTGKENNPYYLKSTPGLLPVLEVGDGPIRMVHKDTSGRIFVASGDHMYILTKTLGVWSATALGINQGAGTPVTLATSTGTIKAASFGKADLSKHYTIFVDGVENKAFIDQGSGQYDFVDISTLGFGTIPGATDITWIDGYFILNDFGTSQFYVSALQSLEIDALDFASAEGFVDPIVAVEANYRDLWLFGTISTEIFVNTGNADFPFERVQGGFLEIGCTAPKSVVKLGSDQRGKLVWLGQTDKGRGIVYLASGLNPQRISTHAIEQAIQSYADMTTAVAYGYQVEGHEFYVINFDEATWVYDLSTAQWHERAYTNSGALERHRGNYHTFLLDSGIHLIGDYQSNKIYELSDSTFTDDGAEITRLRAAPHMSNGMDRVFCSEFQVDMEVGVGLDGTVQGSNPLVMLDFSDDGGHTWSNEIVKSAGKIGEFKHRVKWRRLGKFRDRIFRVRVTDPVSVTLLDAYIKATPGGS